MIDEQKKHILNMIEREGCITTEGIVKEATKTGSPLHDLFEWDNTKAGHQYRLQQARKYIKQVNAFISKEGDKIVHVPYTSRKEGEYRQVKVVVTDVSAFSAALEEALKKLRSAGKDVKLLTQVVPKEHIEVLLGVTELSEEIESWLDKLTGFRKHG